MCVYRHTHTTAVYTSLTQRTAAGWAETRIDHMLATPEFAQATTRPEVVDGIEMGGNRHRALQVQYQPQLAPIEEWGPSGGVAMRVCASGGTEAQRLYGECRRIYSERVQAAVNGAMPRDGGPAAVIEAVQAGTREAMFYAVRRVEPGDDDAEGVARKREARDARGKSPHSAASVRRPSAVQKAQITLRTVDEQTERATAAPTSGEGWLEYVPARSELAHGVPKAFGGVRSDSDVGRRVRRVYGARLEKQMLSGDGGEAASDWAEEGDLQGFEHALELTTELQARCARETGGDDAADGANGEAGGAADEASAAGTSGAEREAAALRADIEAAMQGVRRGDGAADGAAEAGLAELSGTGDSTAGGSVGVDGSEGGARGSGGGGEAATSGNGRVGKRRSPRKGSGARKGARQAAVRGQGDEAPE